VVAKPSQSLPQYLSSIPKVVFVSRPSPQDTPPHSLNRTSNLHTSAYTRSQVEGHLLASLSRNRTELSQLPPSRRYPLAIQAILSIIPEASKLPRALSSSAYKAKNRQIRYANSSKSHALTTFTSTYGYTTERLSFHRRHV